MGKLLNPLLQQRYIQSYSIIEKPDNINKGDKQVRYSNNVIKRHRNIIEAELKDMGVQYEIVEKDKYTKSGKVKEYQVIAKGNKDQVYDITRFLKRRATEFDEIVDFVDTAINPAETSFDAFQLHKAKIVPDIRVLNDTKVRDFAKAKRISLNLDKDTELVVISIKPKNVQKVKDTLKGEQVTEVLVQDFVPMKHSFKKKLLKNTK